MWSRFGPPQCSLARNQPLYFLANSEVCNSDDDDAKQQKAWNQTQAAARQMKAQGRGGKCIMIGSIMADMTSVRISTSTIIVIIVGIGVGGGVGGVGGVGVGGGVMVLLSIRCLWCAVLAFKDL